MLDWCSFYPKDWLEGTAHMTAEQKGIYIDLLAHQWCRPRCEVPLDHAQLAQMVRVEQSVFDEAWSVVSRKFLLGKTGYYNKRLRAEWRKARQLQQKRAESGRSGGLAKARNLLQQKRSKPLARACNCYLYVVSSKSQEKQEVLTTDVATCNGAVMIAPGVELPVALKHTAFVEAWRDWLDYRREVRRTPVSLRAAKMQMAKLAKWPDFAVEAIEVAISNDYQGLFPEKLAGKAGGRRGNHDRERAMRPGEDDGW